MNPSAKQLSRSTVIATALLLAITLAPAAPSAPNIPLTIQAIAIHGNQIMVTVTNRTPSPRTGTVFARVLVNGGDVLASARVTVGGARTVIVTLEAGSPVIGAFPLGVVLDDGVPF
jgi:hypothetical protein